MTLRQRFWHSVRDGGAPRANEKEMRESFDFFQRVSNAKQLLRKAADARPVVIDVCGGHGLLALLFLASRIAARAVVVDVERPATFDAACDRLQRDGLIEDAPDFVQQPLQEALEEAIREAGKDGNPVLVVGCHTCSHLADQVIGIVMRCGARLALCACCHTSSTDGGAAKAIAKSTGTRLSVVANLKRMGRLEERGFQVRWRELDATISPENILLLAWPSDAAQVSAVQDSQQRADERLRKAYTRVHKTQAPAETT